MEPMFPKEMTHNSMGRMKLAALFVETHRPGDEPFLSLKAQKDNGYVSLRDLFIQYVVDDPSEATFAEVVFGDMEHWNQLLACNWMDEHVTKWRAICDAKRKAKAFKMIINEVEQGGKSAFSAAKFLIDEPWKDKRNKATKEAVQKSSEAGFSAVNEDVKRLKEIGLIQ